MSITGSNEASKCGGQSHQRLKQMRVQLLEIIHLGGNDTLHQSLHKNEESAVFGTKRALCQYDAYSFETYADTERHNDRDPTFEDWLVWLDDCYSIRVRITEMMVCEMRGV